MYEGYEMTRGARLLNTTLSHNPSCAKSCVKRRGQSLHAGAEHIMHQFVVRLLKKLR